MPIGSSFQTFELLRTITLNVKIAALLWASDAGVEIAIQDETLMAFFDEAIHTSLSVFIVRERTIDLQVLSTEDIAKAGETLFAFEEVTISTKSDILSITSLRSVNTGKTHRAI